MALDAKDVMNLHQHLKGVWSDAHDKWGKADDYYNLTFNLWPQGMDRPEYHSSRARSIIDSAVDNQLSGTPRVHRPPTGRGEIHHVRADKIEPFIVAVLNKTAEIEPNPTWKQAAKHLLLYGYTIIEGPLLTFADEPVEPERSDFNSDREFERAEAIFKNKQRDWMPFRIRAPHPSRILLDPTSKLPSEGVKEMSLYAHKIHELTLDRAERGVGEVFEFDPTKPYEKIKSIEYWSENRHILIVRGRLVIDEPNTWGFSPWSHAYSGFGSELTEDEFNPSQFAVGMLDFIMEPLKVQSQAQSGRHNALIEAAFTPWGTRKNAAEIAEHLRRGDIVPGINQQDVFKLQYPDLPSFMFKSEGIIDEDIELATFSRQLSGLREEGVSTVGQQAILSSAAARKFVMPQKQIEHLATVTSERVLQLIDVVLDEPITVDGRTIKPEDIDHDYSVHASFEVVDPVLQLQQRELGLREVQAGLKSRETYWSADAQLEDATGEKKRLLKEMVEQSPEVVQFLAREVAREFGLLDVLETAQEQQQTGQPAAPSDSPQGESQVTRELRQGLTPQIPKPGNLPPTAAGSL